MGTYLNPGNDLFTRSRFSNIYVDKSGLIAYTNKVLNTEQRFMCVTRPRRSGKSMAANMLAAYYGKGCESDDLFSNLKIAQDASYKKFMNQFNVIQIDMCDFFDRTKNISSLKRLLNKTIAGELKDEFQYVTFKSNILISMLSETKQKFVFIIDEWDCIFRLMFLQKNRRYILIF